MWILAISEVHASDLRQDASVESRCVALAVFAEARGESVLGQAAVAHTVLQRVAKTRSHPCDIVASNQYVIIQPKDPWLIDQRAWSRAVDISEAVISGDYDLASCHGATHFHNRREKPYWTRYLEFKCTVDAHDFYREN